MKIKPVTIQNKKERKARLIKDHVQQMMSKTFTHSQIELILKGNQ